MANIPADEMIALARFQRLDERNSSEAAKDALLGAMADEVERLTFIQNEFHNVADLVEITRLQARVKWLEEWKDACEDTVARLNRKALHPDVPRKPAPRREQYEPGEYGTKCFEKALLEHSTRTTSR